MSCPPLTTPTFRIGARRVALLAASALSCAHRSLSAPTPDREEVAQELSDFEHEWLEPARVAPPTVDFEPHRVSDGPYSATLRLVLPEDARWNQWTAGSVRLFNNRAAYLFDVQVEGPGALQWLPDRTTLTLNTDERSVRAVALPDELLEPLMSAALWQERFGLPGDLVARTRAAGPFRSEYLSRGDGAGRLHGTLAFLLPDPDRQVVDLTVVVTVMTADGPHPFRFELH